MRPWPALLAPLLLAAASGCLDSFEADEDALDAVADCRAGPAHLHVLYFGPELTLSATEPAAGAQPGNAFTSGFATDDLQSWQSAPYGKGLWIIGEVVLEYWARSTGTPAPLTYPLGGDAPGDAYRFYNLFGSDRSFQPSSAIEYGEAWTPPGTVTHHEQRLAMPPGGFVVEAGDRVRVLLTDLALKMFIASISNSDVPTRLGTCRCSSRRYHDQRNSYAA